MLGIIRRLGHDDSGVIAPTAAIAIFALIGCAGIAFDYARLAALDTELQQAADMAALAAATQLDRGDDAQTRATNAITSATAANRLAANLTKFANDNEGVVVEIPTITFCEEFDDSIADSAAACEEATAGDGANSRYVMVTTEIRTANYALTPVVGALAGTLTASAVAGVESSICNVAPLMVCVADDDFPTAADIGRGIVMKVAGGESWAPGNYGYLDFGNGNQAVIDALVGHGLNGCQSEDDNETEPGNKNATDAINTRMDIYGGTGATNSPSVCDLSTGAGCPAENVRKDMTLEMTYTIRQATQPTTSPNCGTPPGGKPQDATGEVAYSNSFVKDAAAKNFGRDICHYTGTCPGVDSEQNFGDGIWDRDAYIAANHPGETAASIAGDLGGSAEADTLTRFQVYQWEIANKASNTLDPRQISAGAWNQQGQNWIIKKQCSFNEPWLASSAYPAQKDRRILPIVAANCDNLKGKGAAFEDYVILRVFDVFLPEPSLQRAPADTGYAGATVGTDDKEIYGEVIGPAATYGGGGGFQYYSRNKPYLIR